MDSILLITVLSCLGRVTAQNFEPQWISYGGFNYYITYRLPQYSFQEARSLCQSKGAELASITSDVENAVINDAIGTANLNYWIGLQRNEALSSCTANACQSDSSSAGCISCRKQWFWTDGTSMLDNNGNLIYDNWHNQKPYGLAGRNVAFMLSGAGVWNDVSDSSTIPGVLCKKAAECSSNPCQSGEECIEKFTNDVNSHLCDCKCGGGPLFCTA